MPGKKTKFCFESNAWKKTINKVVYFDKIIRQQDPEFCQILSEIRMGKCSDRSYKMLEACKKRKLNNKEGIKPTILYSIRKDVDRINTREINKLIEKGEEHKTFKSTFSVRSISGKKLSAKQKKMFENRCKKECQAPDELTLVNGAQVMLITNLDVEGGLVNGSRGVVTSVNNNNNNDKLSEDVEDVEYVEVKFLNGIILKLTYHSWMWEEDDILAVKSQIPLIIAYSMTIHKTQSQTLDWVIVDLGPSVFENGQAYTALSRVRSLQGLQITSFMPKRIRAHRKVIEFYETLQEKM